MQNNEQETNKVNGRELKFRAWDGLKKEIVTICELDWYAPNMTLFVHNRLDSGGVNGERFTLMQYTGLKDKNGKEIYEGDIIRLLSLLGVVEYGVQDIGHDWQSVGFFTRERDGSQFNLFGGESTEIIGNFYENKDLLND